MLVLGAAVTLVLWTDLAPGDAANQATLLLILSLSGFCGFLNPRLAWAAGLAIGGCVAVAHAIYLLLGVELPYPTEPSGWAGPATLLVLIIPALLAALLGGFLRARTTRRAT